MSNKDRASRRTEADASRVAKTSEPDAAGDGAANFKKIIKEGWLYKCGIRFKTWHSRYFMLRDDGVLYGFHKRPTGSKPEPDNVYTIKECKVRTTEIPRAHMLIVGGMHKKHAVTRTFCANSEEARRSWITAIHTVALKNNPEPLSCGHQKTLSLDDFCLLTLLGHGAFGKVFLCREKETSEVYAIKVVHKCSSPDDFRCQRQLENNLTENHVLKVSQHPFITELKYSFQTQGRICFVMEYVSGGDLQSHLTRDIRFTEDRTRFYGAQIVSAIGYLHSKSIIYRDIKLENLLLDRDGYLKIADMGLCKENMPYGAATNTLCGTPCYLAPEIISDGWYGPAADWWSAGIVMYEMLSGSLPFTDVKMVDVYRSIVNKTVDYPDFVSYRAVSFLSQLLIKEPQQRLGGGKNDYKEVAAHSFFWTINFDDLLHKRIRPPFVPQLTDDVDTKYFDIFYTQQTVRLSSSAEDAIAGPLPRLEKFSFNCVSGAFASGSPSPAPAETLTDGQAIREKTEAEKKLPLNDSKRWTTHPAFRSK